MYCQILQDISIYFYMKILYYSDVPDIVLLTPENSPSQHNFDDHTCDSLCNSAQDKLNHKLHVHKVKNI